MNEPPQARGPERRRAAYRRGRGAEFLAALLLRLKGYRVLARGYRCAVGEIDIIARRGALLVAVEVKIRPTIGEAAHAIDPRQRRRIARALSDFMSRRADCAGCDVRFDAVLVSQRWRPHHISDAWRPGDVY